MRLRSTRVLTQPVSSRTIGRSCVAFVAALTMAGVALLFWREPSLQAQSGSPGGVAGAAVWLKADVGATVNSSGNFANGTGWVDQSGSNRHADRVFGDPQQVPAGINFNPTVVFDGNDFFRFSVAPFASSFTAGETFAVLKDLSPANGQHGHAFDFGAGARGSHYTWVDGIIYDSFGTTDRLGWNPVTRGIADGKPGVAAITGPAVNTSGYHVYRVHSAANDWGVSFDGATAAASTTNAVSFALLSSNESVGTNGVYAFHGEMPEVVLFNRTLTTAERQRVNSYLAIKYGITQLAPGGGAQDYLSSQGTVTWAGAANGTFHNDVAGIGRDDDSGLTQKQSASINPAGIVTMGLGTIAADNQSNPTAFPADDSFLVWGSNTGSTTVNVPVPTTSLTRMARIWRVQETGTVGDVLVRIPASYLTGEQVSLIRSADATIDGTDTVVPLSLNGPSYEATIDFTGTGFFTLAADLPTPGGVNAGLEYWIRPEDMDVSAGLVTNWDDVHGLHTNETMAGGGFFFSPNGFNFHPTATTNGTRYMYYAGQQLLSGATAGEIFYMLQSTGSHSTNDGYPSEFGGSGTAQTWEYDFSDSQIYSGWGSTVRKNWNPLTAPAGGPARDVLYPHVYNVLSRAGEWTARFDGVTNFTTATNAVQLGASPSTHTLIGASASSIFNGRLSEVIAFRRNLTPTERQQVQSYLATKYGVTLGTPASPVTYLASDGTTAYWTGAAAYQNNIAGIGRDDASGLDQRQSRSVNAGTILTIGLGTIAADNASNPNALAADQSFLMWGDDNASTGWGTAVAGSPLQRIARIWTVQETGTVGPVLVRIPRSLIGGTAPTLIRSGDATFDSTDTTAPLTLNGAYFEATVDFTSGEYFTFASQNAPTLQNNGDGFLTDGAVAAMPPASTPVCSVNQFWEHVPVVQQGVFSSGIGNYVQGGQTVNESTHLADVNNDGRLDILWIADAGGASPNNGTYVWLGNGDGTFQTKALQDTGSFTGGPLFPNWMPAGGDSINESTHVADVNGDGSVDIVWLWDAGGNAANAGTWVWLGNGNGTFQHTAIVDHGLAGGTGFAFFPAGGFTAGESTDLVDVNNDGRLDIVWVNDNGNANNPNNGTWVWLGNGNGTWSHTVIETHNMAGGTGFAFTVAGGTSANESTHLVDVDNDGSVDLVWLYDAGVAATSGVRWWKGNGDGTFQQTVNQDFGFAGGPGLTWGAQGGQTINETTRIIDANRDGNLDILWMWDANGISAQSGTYVYLGNGNGTFQHTPLVDVGSFGGATNVPDILQAGISGNEGTLVGDLNGDGMPDLLWSWDAAGAASSGTWAWLGRDSDRDNLADVVDPDDDNDGVPDASDTCIGPGSISPDIQLWLKADGGATVDALGNVTHWTDLSTFGRDANLMFSDPQQIAAGVNFNPTVRFDGDDYFRFGKSPFVNSFTAGEVFTVVKNGGSAAVNNGNPFDLGSGGRASHYTYSAGGGSIYDGFGTTQRLAFNPTTATIVEAKTGVASITGSPFSSQVYHLYSTHSAASDWGVRVDGTVTAATSTNTVSFALTTGNEHIGAVSGAAFIGDVAEVILYNRTLTASERSQVESYLATKYGLTLGHDYLASDDTTVYWNVAAHGLYHNNVAGIGRDDNATLDQRQSTSANPGSIVAIGLGTVAPDNQSNPNAFGADLQFMLWGDNNASTSFNTRIAPPTPGMATRRMPRTWTVQETGAVGDVTVAVPETLGSGNPVYLVVSSDEMFDATDQWLLLTPLTAGSTTWQAANLDLASGQFFTFATNVTAPGGVTGNFDLWLKANAGTGTTTDATSVATWVDQTGSGNDAANGTAAWQPLFRTSAADLMNFNPVLAFDSANDWLRVPTFNPNPSAKNPLSVAMTYRITDGGGLYGNDNGQYDLGHFTNIVLGAEAVVGYGGGHISGQPLINDAAYNHGVGGGSFVYINTRQTLAFTYNGADGGNGYLDIGVNGQPCSGCEVFFGGWISEYILYNRALTAAERQQVDSYLAIKYGVTLDQTAPTNYLDSTGSVIWNAATGGVYKNNIAGIGRDDVSLLVQRQSHSGNTANTGNLVAMGLGTIAVDNVSNASSFPDDLSFLVWGDDGAAVTFGGAIAPPSGGVGLRMPRTWNLQETGTVGTVTVGVPATLGGGQPLYLIASSDAVFDAADVWLPMVPLAAGSTAYLAATHDFTTGQYFTFATVLPEDYGDAPTTYGTTLAGNGARHAVPGYVAGTNTAPLMLGTLIDVEADGQPNATASADDASGADDEGGVTFPALVAGQAANLTVAVTNSGAAARLSAWADWNNNGSFADAGEQVAVDAAVVAGNNTVPLAVPATASGTINLRFRLSTQTGLGPLGAAPDGEVEDYQVATVRQTDLSITKTDSRTSYTPGAPITYTIVVSNAGPSAASGVSIADTVPATITGVTVSCAAGGTANCGTNASTANTISFTGASLNAGAGNQLTLTVSGTVAAATTGSLANTASVTAGAGQTDPNTANNSATDTDTEGPGSADLVITKADGQAGYTPGTPITYTVTVTNAGPSNAPVVNLADAVPASITGVTASCVAAGAATCGTDATSGNNVSFTGASIEAGAGNSLTLTINGTVDPGATGTLTNTAQVLVPGGATYADPNLGNNSSTDTNTQGTPQIDLSVTKTDNQTSYVPGAPISYTIEVTNAGPSSANGFSISDAVPASITGVTVNCAVIGFGSCGTNATAGNNVSFTNASLAPGANLLRITLNGTVSPDTAGDLTNSATATGGGGANDTDPANNTASDTDTQAAGESDLRIAKTNGQAGYIAGTAITYTMTVANDGPSHAPSFELRDLVPAMITGLTVNCAASGTATCGTDGSTGNSLLFTGASLNAGAGNGLTITVSGTIDPDFTSTDIVNSAQVTVPAGAGYTDPALANNTATDTDTPLPQEVDLAITKTDGQTEYVPGAPISYTLVVTNAGPSTATDVSITDLVPASITGVTASCVVTGTGNCGSPGAPGNAVSFTNATLAPGAGHSLTMTISGTVDPDAAGDLTNEATVTAGTGATEMAPANNAVSDTDAQAEGVADLTISKTDGAAVYTPGTPATYQIVVTNHGPSHAAGFSIEDVVPAAITGVTASCAVSNGVGSCGTNASSGNNLSFTGVSLEAGSALTLTLNGTIDAAATGDLTNTATVTVPGGAGFTDPDPASNSASDTDTQSAQAIDLTVTVDDGQATYVPGTPITYTVTVTNAGPSLASGFNVSDVVPAGITGASVTCAVSGTGACGTNNSSGPNILFSNAQILPGEALTITITGTVAPDATGDLVSTATVTAGSGANEASTADNSATDTDTPAAPEVDLVVTKANSQTTYVPGTPVRYTMTVTNGGPSTATGVGISDTVPPGITGVTVLCAVSGTADCGVNGSSGNVIAFTDASLAPGAGNALTLTVDGVVGPGATGPLDNTVTVTAGGGATDTNPANNSATDTDAPGTSQIDLTVTKTDGQASYVAGTPIAYTITVTNAGPSVAAGVSISDTVPAAITGVSVACVPSGGASCGTDGSSGNTVSFTNAMVPPGAGDGLTLTVSGTVSPTATGALDNTVTVAAPGATDANPADNTATDSDTEGPPQVDLTITKTNSQPTYVPGTPVTYTITVTNAGPSAATGVEIVDTVPSEITGLSVNCAATGTASCGTDGSAGNGVAFSNASLALGAGHALTLTISGTVSPTASGVLANTATVTAGGGATETNPSDNSATDSDNPGTAQVDLTVTKTNGQTTYVPGTTVTYTLTVMNAGPSSATGVAISDSVPASITSLTVSCTAAGASVCGSSLSTGNDISISNATVAPGAGQALTITISGTIDAGATGPIVNTATVAAGPEANEQDPSDNSATDSDTAGTGSADLTITKTDGQGGYIAGNTITYTLTVTNAGPSNAAAVDISDLVPASITGVTVNCVPTGTATCGTNASSGNTVSFTGASLNAGAGNLLTLMVSGTIDPGAAGNLVNTAQVLVPAGASYSDPDLGNNSATDTNTAGTPQVDLVITKTDGQTEYVPGAPITYTLVVTNGGPSTATDISISDLVPASITGVTANCAVVGLGNCGTNSSSGNTVAITNATLAPGVVNTLTITVTGTVSPDLTGDLTNTATVTAAGATELDPSNNSASDTDTQGSGQSDLSITKTDGQAGYIAGSAVTYTLTVTNNGPSHAPNLEVHDVIPPMIAGASVTCATTGTGSCGADGSSGNTIAFTGASLNAGAGHAITITVSGTVDPSFIGGDVVNTAEVRVPATAGYSDPTLGNNTVTDTNTPLPQHVDLAITKTDGQASYVPGAAVTYTLVVTNNGPSTASDVNIADVVPASLSGVTASCVATGVANCGSNATAGNNVSFTNASVYPGAGHGLTISISGTVSPDTTGDLVNSATVTAGTGAVETAPANNTVSDTDTQGGNVSDLSVTKTDGTAVYTAGTSVTYQIVVTNNGPSHAAGFQIDDVVPASITGVSVTCAVSSGVGTCGTNASAGNTLAFAGAGLNAGSSLTLMVTGTIDPSATGDLVNTATVTLPGGASFTDPDTANNTATDTDTATAQSIDLTVAIDDGQAAYVAGTPITYTITVTNAGPSTATGFSFGDVVPTTVSGFTATCAATGTSSCGSDSSSGNTLLFSNATLLPGETLTLTVSGTIAPSATGDLVHTATVTPGPGASEANAGDNSATDTDTAAASEVDLAVAKDDGQANYVPGTAITYTITVTNAGPSTATDFSFADTVPAGITSVTVSCAVTGSGACGTNGSSGNNVAFTGLSLDPGAANALTFLVSGMVDPGATGSIDNAVTVTVGGGATDTNPANNGATDSDTAGTSQVDLTVTKTNGQTSYVPGTPVSYTITVTNAGPSTATGVSLADGVSAAITGVTVACVPSGTASCGANGSSGNNVSFTGASIAPGVGNALTFAVTGTVRPDATGPLVNTATVVVGAGTTDANPADNTATDTDAPGAAQVDLTIAKTDGQDSYVPGTPITYTITVTNAGPSTANGSTVADTVPASITGVTVSCAVAGTGVCGTNGSSGNAISFSNATLAPGAGNALTLIVSGTVSPGAAGPLANTATVSAGGGATDTNAANNSATDTNPAGTSQVDLLITKTNGQTTYVPGVAVSYTITVTNAGPSQATGFSVTDSVPAAITGVTVTCAVAGAGDCGANGSSGNAVSFTNASLAPGAGNTLIFTVSGTTDPAATGPLANTAVVTAGSATDTNPSNNSATDTDTDMATADVEITQAGPAGAVTPGETFTYQVTVTNQGPSTATGVIVSDALPPGITLVSSPEGCTAAGQTVTCPTMAALPPGTPVVYTLTVRLSPDYTGNGSDLPNVASVTAGTPDPDMANNTTPPLTLTVNPPSADLATSKAVLETTVTPGGTFTYRITVINNGPSTATNVAVTDPLPAPLAFVSATSGCAAGGQLVTCGPVATLAPGTEVSFELVVRLDPAYTGDGSDLANVATAASNTTDPDPSNDSNPPTPPPTVGAPQSDLQMVKHVSPDVVLPGQNYSYTLQVTNNGPSVALNAVVTDPLPAQATFVSSTAGCTAVGQMVTCPTVPVMTVGQTATFDIVVQLNPGYTGDGSDVLNSATVTSATQDPAPQNNSNPSGAPPVGPPGADVTIVKTVSAAPVVPGETFSYTLLVSNQGPSVATDVVTTDPLPAWVTFVSSASGCTAAGQDVTCPTIATLNPGGSATFTFVARIDPGYVGDGSDLPNRAVVTAATLDPVPANNTSAPVTPNVADGIADLSSTKVALGNAVSPGMLFVYRISVANAGPSTARDVTVTDHLPVPLTFITSNAACTAAAQVVTCTQPALAPGATAAFDLTVRLDPAYAGDGTDLVNTATVSSSTPDPDPTNNDPTPAPAPPLGVGESDVTITKTGPYGPVPSGGEITFTLVITNQGPNAAQDVQVHDDTPAGLTFLETAGDCTTAFPCTLGTLLPGQARTITARYSVPPSVTGVITNTATVTSSTPDPLPSNSTATAKTPPDALTYYLAEGATGVFFDSDLLVANPHEAPAPITARFFREDGTVVTQTHTLAPRSRLTVRMDEVPQLEATTASVQVTSEDGLPLAVERTMFWDPTYYGGHTGTAVTQPSTRWYFAEGSQGYFDTYLLLENAHATAAEVRLTFLREFAPPVVHTLTVGPFSRSTVHAGGIPEIVGSSFGIDVDSTQPIVAERAMYLGTTAERLWSGGHSSAGVIEPARRWFYAEGATGTFFDTFILLSNPHTLDAHVTLEYILQNGEVVTVPKVVRAQGRLTVSIDTEEDERLHNAAVSTRITSDIPIVTERSMYWGSKNDVTPWGEGHNSFGMDQTALRWAVAEGRVGGPLGFSTYILLTNPQTVPAQVTITYVREGGKPPLVKTYTVPPTTRFNVDVNTMVPELTDEPFGAGIEVTNGTTINVERSIYWNANGIFWTAGTNAPGTKLP